MTLVNQQIIRRCLEKIKVALQAKDLMYEDVAELLGVSEVTIKRTLNNDDIGLERLMALAEVAGLDVVGLIDDARNQPQPHTFLTQAQDNAFLRYPYLYRFFCELFYEKKSAAELIKEHKLTKLSVYVYLTALENLSLIKLSPNNEFQFLVQAPLGFGPDSRYLKNEISHYIQQTSDFVLSEGDSEGHFMIVKPMLLSSALYQRLLDDFVKIVDQYSEISELGLVEGDDTQSLQVNVITHPYQKMPDVKLVNVKSGHFKLH